MPGEKGGLKYTKGISASTFMPMIDMSTIREKRKEALKELEDALEWQMKT